MTKIIDKQGKNRYNAFANNQGAEKIVGVRFVFAPSGLYFMAFKARE